MNRIHLRILVPKNRNLPGWLRVEVNGTPVKEMRVLARGSRGEGNTSLLRNGNTPTGEYRGSVVSGNGTLPEESYGPWGILSRHPFSSDRIITRDDPCSKAELSPINGGNLSRKGTMRFFDWHPLWAIGPIGLEHQRRPLEGFLQRVGEENSFLPVIPPTARGESFQLSIYPAVLLTMRARRAGIIPALQQVGLPEAP